MNGFKFESGLTRGRYIVRDLSLPFHKQYIGYVDRRGVHWVAMTYASRTLTDDSGDTRLFVTRRQAAQALRDQEAASGQR